MVTHTSIRVPWEQWTCHTWTWPVPQNDRSTRIRFDCVAQNCPSWDRFEWYGKHRAWKWPILQIDYWVTCWIAVLLYGTSLTWPAIKAMIWLMRSLVSSLLMSPRRSVSQIFLVFVIISNLGSCALRSSFNAFCCWCDPVLSFVSFSTNRSVAPPDRHPIYHSCSFCWYHRRLLDLLPCVLSLPWL